MTEIPPSIERESMEVDVVIVGAGPAGLATACRLMQLAAENERELSIVVLEKAAAVGDLTLNVDRLDVDQDRADLFLQASGRRIVGASL